MGPQAGGHAAFRRRHRQTAIAEVVGGAHQPVRNRLAQEGLHRTLQG
jgi:hypothetical protein